MTWVSALTTGAGLGLVFFGGLWLTVLEFTRRQRVGLIWASYLARMALAALVFYGLSREGPDMVLAGLGGLWLSRWYLIRRLGGSRNVCR